MDGVLSYTTNPPLYFVHHCFPPIIQQVILPRVAWIEDPEDSIHSGILHQGPHHAHPGGQAHWGISYDESLCLWETFGAGILYLRAPPQQKSVGHIAKVVLGLESLFP